MTGSDILRQWPAPVNNFIIIKQKNTPGKEVANFRLYNLLGELVLEKTVEVNTKDPINLTSGFYVFVIANSNVSVIDQGKILIKNNT